MPRDVFNDKHDSGDNICYTSTLLIAGWILGILLALGVFLTGSLPTCQPMTEIETAVLNTSTLVNGTGTYTESFEVEFCAKFETVASACTVIGILLLPTILITVVVQRRKNEGEDLCVSDTMGIGIVGAGAVSGVIAGIGFMLQSAMDTTTGSAGGTVLLILVAFTLWTTVQCSRCYENWKAEQDGTHLF